MASKVASIHLHEAQAISLGETGDRASLLSICSGPLPSFKDFLRTAIRTGDKTQTRRIVNSNAFGWKMRDDSFDRVTIKRFTGQPFCSPHGIAGQVRYLREPLTSSVDAFAYYLDDGIIVKDIGRNPVKWYWKNKALPQLFMPKEYARTFVYMKNIRIEKLQDIQEVDAVAEGCRGRTVGDGEIVGTARADFARLWCGINGKGSWAPNQWVWVLEWKVIYGGTENES